MTTLSTIAEVKAEGNLPAAMPADKLQPSLDMASIELRTILGADLYTTILGYKSAPSSGDDTRTDPQKLQFTICSKAEALMSMSFAVHKLNIATQGDGIVKSQGWDQSRSDLLSQDEATKLSELFRNQAMTLLNRYMPVNTEDPDTIKSGEYIIGDDGSRVRNPFFRPDEINTQINLPGGGSISAI